MLIERAMISDFLKESGVDAAFIEKDENCRYISGFTGSDSYLFLTADDCYLLTDSRYTEQAKEEAKGFTIIDYAGKLAKTVGELSAKHHVTRFGIEAGMTYKMYLSFDEVLPETDFVFVVPDTLRQIKSAEEIRLIEEACRISDLGFEKTVPYIKAGVTEAELRTILECAMLEAGSEGKSFDTIVASGLHSAMPHAVPTAKKLEKGDFITMDFGCRYDGYCSDMTRTVVLGEASSKQKEIYGIVLKAQMAALEQICAGKTGSEVDQVARGLIAEAGYGEYFGHGLGHSVGLFIHEEPRLSPKCHSVLQKNMTMTVEPGIYIPEFGGVRIEDLVVITEKGCRNLAHSPKELIEL